MNIYPIFNPLPLEEVPPVVAVKKRKEKKRKEKKIKELALDAT
jgi:hypothetical protein